MKILKSSLQIEVSSEKRDFTKTMKLLFVVLCSYCVYI